MPPHIFFGYTLDEWLMLLSIAGVFVAVISWFIRKVVIDPIRNDMKASNTALMSTLDVLSEKVANIGGNANKVHDSFDKRLNEHDHTLTQHDEQIKTLYKLEGKKFKDEN